MNAPADMRGTIVLDLDGVVYLDAHGVPGAGDALRSLQADGWHLVYATNNSTKTRADVVRHIEERTGFEAYPADAVTSAMAAAAHVRGAMSAAYVGSPSIGHELEAVGVEVVEPEASPEAVVVGLDRSITYGRIDRAARAIRSGARLVATNTDATYPTRTGPAPGAGTIVAAIATAAGADAVSCGKPHEPFAQLVRARLTDGPVLIVGDRPETDIALGRRLGWGTVLVMSGVTETRADVPDDLAPDHVLGSIAELPALLARDAG